MHFRLYRRLSALAIIALVGCQTETTLEETTPASSAGLQILSPPQLPPAIREHALSIGSALQKQTLFAKNERSFGTVANGRIHRVERPDGRVSYTLPLQKLGAGLYYDNLVIEQLPDGTTTETLIRYEPQREWWENSKGVYDYATYSGRVSFFTATGEPIASVVLQEGKIAPSPADKTGTAQRIEVSCYITDIQYAGLEQDGTFYITDIMYWFECEVYVDGNMSPDGGGYGTGGTGGGVGSAPTGEPEYAEDGGAAGNSGDTPATGEEEEILINPEFLAEYPCQAAIVQQAYGACSPLTQLVLSLFEANNNVNLVFTSAPDTQMQGAGGLSNASTSAISSYNPTTRTCDITVRIRESYLETATDLSIARTAIHESLHAVLVYMYEDGLLTLPNGTPEPPFVDLVDAYINRALQSPQNLNNTHHELMASFVGDIATALSAFGSQNGYNLPFSYYEALSWHGLHTTPDFNVLYPQYINGVLNPERITINNIMAAEQNNQPYPDGNGNPIVPQGVPCQ